MSTGDKCLVQLLTAFRDFLKNAEADEKKGNNVDATKKDAGR
jgi:F-type H+-transporting ATPase subunit k